MRSNIQHRTVGADSHIWRYCGPAILGCVLAITSVCAAQEQHPGHTWDYGTEHGPTHWGELAPEFAECKVGHHQSPIDIRHPQAANLPPIEFHYEPSALDIIDNGHTIMINYGPGSYMTVGGKKYVLKQFHFHHPSEEKINGKSYQMTVHFVHADEDGKLAVVAVLLKKGEDNPLVHELWKDMPQQKEKEELLSNVQIDADRLLPADHSYYTFAGSLTTPPCSEDVTWFVMKHPVTVSSAEISQFAKLYRNDARPTQPLNDRVVQASK
jgi:carbonic anhydrase